MTEQKIKYVVECKRPNDREWRYTHATTVPECAIALLDVLREQPGIEKARVRKKVCTSEVLKEWER